MLVIEDNDADLLLIQEALEESRLAPDVHYIKDGEAAFAFIDRADNDSKLPCPDLVILDINLPKRHGGQVLQHLRESRRCKAALVLAISSSDSLRDRSDMSRLGANGYFKKPSEYDEFMKLAVLVRKLLGVS